MQACISIGTERPSVAAVSPLSPSRLAGAALSATRLRLIRPSAASSSSFAVRCRLGRHGRHSSSTDSGWPHSRSGRRRGGRWRGRREGRWRGRRGGWWRGRRGGWWRGRHEGRCGTCAMDATDICVGSMDAVHAAPGRSARQSWCRARARAAGGCGLESSIETSCGRARRHGTHRIERGRSCLVPAKARLETSPVG